MNSNNNLMSISNNKNSTNDNTTITTEGLMWTISSMMLEVVEVLGVNIPPGSLSTTPD